MKKLYTEPSVFCVILANTDILTTSGCGEVIKIGSAGEYIVNGADL